MKEAIEEEEYRGYMIRIYPDFDPMNPREWDNMGTMIWFHRRYLSPDKNPFSSPEELIDFINREDIISLPVYGYDHSGLSISTGRGGQFSDPWDSGKLGYIYVTREKILKDFNRKKISKALIKKAYDILEGEVETFGQYLTGDVYGYEITGPGGDFIDSCWGFFPPMKDILGECRDIIDYHIMHEPVQYPAGTSV